MVQATERLLTLRTLEAFLLIGVQFHMTTERRLLRESLQTDVTAKRIRRIVEHFQMTEQFAVVGERLMTFRTSFQHSFHYRFFVRSSVFLQLFGFVEGKRAQFALERLLRMHVANVLFQMIRSHEALVAMFANEFTDARVQFTMSHQRRRMIECLLADGTFVRIHFAVMDIYVDI